MDRYENLGVVGEGSYGIVMKCRHKESKQIVAIKKFLDTDDDQLIRKIAFREIKMLKKLRHENLVNLIEVFRRRKHLFLVFEYVNNTILDVLQQNPTGIDSESCRKYIWQTVRAASFCHSNNIVHRDIKPENVLVSKLGIVKLCDFGFARTLSTPGITCTDYVATRWYRAPELLVGDESLIDLFREVDIWAIGCLFAEMKTGEPLFPGESDIDQLFRILCHAGELGDLAQRHKEVISSNPMFAGLKTQTRNTDPLHRKFTNWDTYSLKFLQDCLKLDPDDRADSNRLLDHRLFTWDGFRDKFHLEFKRKLEEEFSNSHWILRQAKYNRTENDLFASYHEHPPTSSKIPISNIKSHAKVTQMLPMKPRIVTSEYQDDESNEIKATPLAIIPPIANPKLTSKEQWPSGNSPHPSFIPSFCISGEDMETASTPWSLDKLQRRDVSRPISPTPNLPLTRIENGFIFGDRSPRYRGLGSHEKPPTKKTTRTDINLPRFLKWRNFQLKLYEFPASVGANAASRMFSFQTSFPKFLTLEPSSPGHRNPRTSSPPCSPGVKESSQPQISLPRCSNS